MSHNNPLQFHLHSILGVHFLSTYYIPFNMYAITALAYLAGLAASMPVSNTDISLASNNVAVYWGMAVFPPDYRHIN